MSSDGTRLSAPWLTLTRRHALSLGGATVVSAMLESTTGCHHPPPPRIWRGVDVASGQELELHPSAMPPNESFTGVYLSPHVGRIELTQTGDRVTGRYAGCEQCPSTVKGTLRGMVVGNLAELEWIELGPDEASGTGFFFLDAMTRVRLFGERQFSKPRRTDNQTWIALRI